jgi:hypothetical protein
MVEATVGAIAGAKNQTFTADLKSLKGSVTG